MYGMNEVGIGPGWAAFLNPGLFLQYAAILVAATLSGAALAYHPVTFGRRITLEDMELRKTLIIYSAVGAMISIICSVAPTMAFVIFGIGGLMRFRTELNTSKSTGHAIVGTLVGLCWGLGLQLVAVIVTAYFWLIVFFLERQIILQMTVGGLDITQMGAAEDAYCELLEKAGCKVMTRHKNFKIIELGIVFALPRKMAVSTLDTLAQALPPNLRGTPNWPK